jgi:hypothetical protein
MNWEMISAIGQMLGAIGVVVSLIYLAIQICGQKKESRNAVISSLVTQFNDFVRSQVESADFCALWLRGLHSFDDLDATSKLRFGSQLGRQLRMAESLYLHFLEGTLDPGLWPRGVVSQDLQPF